MVRSLPTTVDADSMSSDGDGGDDDDDDEDQQRLGSLLRKYTKNKHYHGAMLYRRAEIQQ